MVDAALSRDDVLTALREHGFRLTRPRQIIVESIRRFKGSFSADDLLHIIQKDYPDIGRATVFRTLDVLSQLRILDRIHAPDGCHTYVLGQGASRHYHHLICSSCGTVVPFEACNVEDIYADLQARTDFQISSHMLEIFGLCTACQP